MNHASTGAGGLVVHGTGANRTLVVTAGQQQLPGSELRVSYASGGAEEKCAHDFYLAYGFVPAAPMYDCLDVKLILPAVQPDKAAARRLQLLQQYSSRLVFLADNIAELTFHATAAPAQSGAGAPKLDMEPLLDQVERVHQVLQLSDQQLASLNDDELQDAMDTRAVRSRAVERAVSRLDSLQTEVSNFWDYFIAHGSSVPDACFKSLFLLHQSNERIATAALRGLTERMRTQILR